MTRIGRASSLFLAIVLAAGLTAALLATRSGNASGSKSQTVVKVAHNAALGKRILVTRSGMTLYSLSAERHGRDRDGPFSRRHSMTRPPPTGTVLQKAR